jgi:hypothetical protein
VYYTSPITQVIAPGQGTVTTTSLASSTGSGAVVLATSPTLTTPALGTPSAVNLTNATSLGKAALPTGVILQVVQTKQPASSFSTSSTTYVDVTGISLSITPRSATNTILVSIQGGQNGLYVNASYTSSYNLVRNSTQLAESLGAIRETGNQSSPCAMMYLDSPATTSAITYKMQAKVSSANAVQVYSATDMLTITAMEIVA